MTFIAGGSVIATTPEVTTMTTSTVGGGLKQALSMHGTTAVDRMARWGFAAFIIIIFRLAAKEEQGREEK